MPQISRSLERGRPISSSGPAISEDGRALIPEVWVFEVGDSAPERGEALGHACFVLDDEPNSKHGRSVIRGSWFIIITHGAGELALTNTVPSS